MSRSNPASKSGPTKTVKPPKCIERNWTRIEALSIFMIKEYLPKYFEVNPPVPTTASIPEEIVRSGHVKWFYMSDSEKAPWIELAEKMLAKGISIQDTVAPTWFQLLEASN